MYKEDEELKRIEEQRNALNEVSNGIHGRARAARKRIREIEAELPGRTAQAGAARRHAVSATAVGMGHIDGAC